MSKDVVHVYQGILLSLVILLILLKRNKIEPVEVMWMTLEPVLQGEISQKMKNKHINTYIWNLENGTHEPTCRAGIEVQTERMDLWTWEGEDQQRRTQENNIGSCKTEKC